MKRPSVKALAVLAGSFLFFDAAMGDATAAAANSATPVWTVKSRAANETRFESVVTRTNSMTGVVLANTNRLVHLGPGLNVQAADGSFVPSDPSFEIVPDGGAATNAAHKIFVPGEIGGANVISVTKPDGQQVTFAPVGLDYFDPSTGQSVPLDFVTAGTGWLVSSNVVVYSNCFQTIKGSIRVRNTHGGVECDLLLHEQPPGPESFGLSSYARLEMMTEQISGPVASAQERVIAPEGDLNVVRTFVEPTFNDATLDFGAMKMVTGHAFAEPQISNTNQAAQAAQVGKTYLNIDGRRVLVEGVPYRNVAPVLTNLPINSALLTNATAENLDGNRSASVGRKLPKAQLAVLSPKPIKQPQRLMAAARAARSPSPFNGERGGANPSPLLVLDYQLVNSSQINNYHFETGVTYFIDGYVHAAGETHIGGGAVLKFSSGSALFFDTADSVICDTDPYLPAVFTAEDDGYVGEVVTAMSGSGPTLLSATYPFIFASGTRELHDIRVRYLNSVAWHQGGTLTARNVQAVSTIDTFKMDGTSTLNVFNCLAYSGRLYAGATIQFNGQHITKHFGTLGYASVPGSSSCTIKNSLLVQLSSAPSGIGDYVPTQAPQLSSASGVFQTAAGGNYYLATSTYRDSGVSEIDSTLSQSLGALTTFAPNLITNGNLLFDRKIGDTGSPDLGYHYSRVDHLADRSSSVSLSVTGGVTVALLSVTNPVQNVFSRGTAAAHNRFIFAGQVGEWGVDDSSSAAFLRGDDVLQLGASCDARFTDFTLAGLGHHAACDFFDSSGSYPVSTLLLQDCHLDRASLTMYANTASGISASLINNLVTDSYINFDREPYDYCYDCWDAENNPYEGYLYAPWYLTIRNNFFQSSSLLLYNNLDPFTSGSATIQDNLFSGSLSVSDYTGITASHNGFTGTGPASVDGSGNVNGLTLDFVSGPLGGYYYPSSGGNLALLIDQGDSSAANAGFFHYTTSATQAKEGASTLDIGFHYVAVDASGNPMDYDGDGLPDYFEDSNGNGLYASGDLADYRNKDSDGDGLNDDYEYFSSQTSLTAAITSGTTSDAYRDSDGDGLLNQEEMQSGKNPLVPDVATPLFSVLGGTYASAQTVTLTCPTTGATIRYTTDGSEPTASSTAYSSAISVPINTTLKAKAFKTGWTPSDTESERYQTAANAAPTVSVLPASGLTFGASDSIELLVQGADTDGTIKKLQLYRGTLKVAEAAPGPLRYTLNNVPSGSYVFTARAIDDGDAVTASSSVTITISASGPTVSLVGAQPFFTSSPGALIATITGVNPGSLSSVTLNGSAVPARAGEFFLYPNLVEGENTFTLTVNGTVSATTKVYLDTVAPVIAISKPVNSSTLGFTRVNVTGTFTEASLKRITVNGVLAFVTSPGNFEARNVPLETGANTITATAEDIAGNTTSATISVTGGASLVNPVQLTVTPVAGFAYLSTTFSVTRDSSLNGLSVEYDYEGNGSTDQTDGSTIHSYAAGQYFPVVTIQDGNGNRFSSLGGWNAGSALRINVQEAPEQLSSITISDPVDLKIGGPDSHLYVLSRSARTLKEYDSSDTEVRSLSSIGTSSSVPTGLDVDSVGNIYIALSGDHQVAKYTWNGSAYAPNNSFGASGLIGKSNQTTGTGDGEFNTPYDVAVSPDGAQIAVSDSLNHRIQTFSAGDGSFIGAFGTQGSGDGHFNTPKGLTFDGSGYLYIVDSGNDRVALFLSSALVGYSGSSGSALGQFSGAVNLCVGPRGLYVGETGNNRVQIFDPRTGGHDSTPTPFNPRLSISTEFSLSQPNAATAIADALVEKLYIADTGHGLVIKVSLPEGETPDVKWEQMKTLLLAGNVDDAVPYFSVASKEEYRRSFTSMGSTLISSVMNKTLTPAFIGGDSAQYYFQDVVAGQTITFPVAFVKENGTWKILEF